MKSKAPAARPARWARHSVHAAPATNGYKFPPTSPSQPVADHGFSQMLSSLFPFLRFETAPHNHPTHRRRPTGGRARHSVRAALGIQPPELSTVVAIQTCAAHLKLETFKKPIMQVTVCKSVTLAAKAPKMPGHVATGFPRPSTGRGIEGEGWSYPEPPPGA
jgi:hypothetical protein